MVDVYYVFIPLTKVIAATISTSTNTSTPSLNWFLFCHPFPSLTNQRGPWDLAALLSLHPQLQAVWSLFILLPKALQGLLPAFPLTNERFAFPNVCFLGSDLSLLTSHPHVSLPSLLGI